MAAWPNENQIATSSVQDVPVLLLKATIRRARNTLQSRAPSTTRTGTLYVCYGRATRVPFPESGSDLRHLRTSAPMSESNCNVMFFRALPRVSAPIIPTGTERCASRQCLCLIGSGNGIAHGRIETRRRGSMVFSVTQDARMGRALRETNVAGFALRPCIGSVESTRCARCSLPRSR